VAVVGVAGTAEEGGEFLRTIYVNNSTGDDSRTITQAQNSSTPFATIGRATRGSTDWAAPSAAQAAIAGDLVSVAYTGSPYSEVGYRGANTSLHKSSVMCNCANDGTSENPITIRGTGGKPEIRAATAADRGGAIGSDNRDYIVWDGFTVNDYYLGSGSDFGPTVLNFANYCTIQNCTIQGHTGSYFWGHDTYAGNYRGVAIEDSTYCTVRNNKISRITGVSSGANECGVMMYDSAHNVIEQNTIDDCGTGVFIKGWHEEDSPSPDGNIIRRNLIRTFAYAGVRVLTSFDAQVYQNIIVGSGASEQGGLYSGNSNCENTTWQNNVVYGVDIGMTTQNTELQFVNIRYLNNIVMSSTYVIYSNPIEDPTGEEVTWNRNCYSGFTRVYQTDGVTNAPTFANWQALDGTLCDPNGVNSDPLFVNAASGDFHLQGGSPCLTLGRDALNISGLGVNATIPTGAYITGSEQIGADW
jgi:hypothetical protein